MPTTLAASAGTQLAADALGEVVRRGGNAIDAAVAATFVTWVVEPGITALGSGGFLTVWPPDEDPVTIDGFVEMPGRGADPARFGVAKRIEMPFGGKAVTHVGPGSIGTPGGLAALHLGWERFGSMPWSELVQPAIALARDGFPISELACSYFAVSGEPIFCETPGAEHVWRRPDGTPRAAGETLRIPDLADTLEAVAGDGAGAMYGGAIGERIGTWIRDRGGLLGPEDFASYRAVPRPSLQRRVGGWRVATNPLPRGRRPGPRGADRPGR